MKKELTSEQKEIKRLYQIEWRKNNIDKVKKYNDAHKNYNKEYYKINKNKIKYYVKEYAKNNKEKINKRKRIYAIENKDKINQKFKDRRKNDNLFRIKQDCRNMLNKAFKRFNKPKKTELILGCTFEFFKEYIETKFEYWMTWENKGLYNSTSNYGWDIDHIIPLDTAETIEDIIRLNYYTNLEPLCSHINRDIKKNNIWK